MCESPLENLVAIDFFAEMKMPRRRASHATFNKRTCQEARRLLHRGTTGTTAKLHRRQKRRAACASHASRLVKCDVLKVRLDPFESGAAPAFPSVPPTKSGEFAHFKSDRPTRWRFFWLRPCHESPGRAPDQARTCVRVLLRRRPRQGALCTSHSVVARDFARGATLEQA